MDSTLCPQKLASTTAWHSLSSQTVGLLFGTDFKRGLSSASLEARKTVAKRNAHSLRGSGRNLARRVHVALIGLLFLMGIVAAANQQWTACLVIASLYFINAAYVQWQDRLVARARATLILRNMWTARALRNGKLVCLASSDLVPGDVIVLMAGDTVPADARLFVAEDLVCDEQALTHAFGYTRKSIESVPATTPVEQQVGMIHMGAHVMSGNGRAVVVATGAESIIGLLGQINDEQAHA